MSLTRNSDAYAKENFRTKIIKMAAIFLNKAVAPANARANL